MCPLRRCGEPSRFKGGRFELTIDEATPESLQLRILAAGYAPATSETIRLEGTHVLEFKLSKDPSFDARAVQRAIGGTRFGEALVIKGTIVDPNGRPMPQVAVGVVPLHATDTVTDAEDNPIPGANVYCYGRGQSDRQVKTDAQGRFVIRGVSAGIAQVQANTLGQTRLFGRVQTEGGATAVKIVLRPMGTAGRFVPARPPSLVGKPLPSLAGLGINLSADAYKDKRILLCFFDLGQRPSRHCLDVLAQQAEALQGKGITVVAIPAAGTDEDAWKTWVKDGGGDACVARTSAWGVQSLPWLILADKAHIVRAEGFRPEEIDQVWEVDK